MGDKVGDKVCDKMRLTTSQVKALAGTRSNPNIAKQELYIVCSLPKTLVVNVISYLKKLHKNRLSLEFIRINVHLMPI